MPADPHQDDQEVMYLFQFTQPAEAAFWQPIDDRVMGGISTSQLRVAAGVAFFEGTVSLEQNGGFASVQTQRGYYDLSGYQGLELRIRGVGKRYQLRLRCTPYIDNVAYRAQFVPPQQDIWHIVRLPFTTFEPVFRGALVPDAAPLDPGAIVTFGLMIAHKQAGAFSLQIEWIRAYRTR